MTQKNNIYLWTFNYKNSKTTFPSELVILPTNWSPPRGDSCLSSNPVTKTPNESQSEDSLSASTLRTRRRMYPKERPMDIIRPKKAAKGPQITEESLREHA